MSATEPTLEEYRNKRDFRRTTEPTGTTKEPVGNIFVVQKHAASHLHYDFRLRLHGALKSWAVPKGPSVDPTIHRLASQTEDHPLDYANFEGVIPAGQYGAGTVLIWDEGEWEPLGEGKQGFYHGRLEFILHGKRLRGRWSLTREGSDGKSWQLIKEADEFASATDIITEQTSVVSGRTMEEIAAHPERLWTREAGALEQVAPPVFGHRLGGDLPQMIAPQAATLVDQVPTGDHWLHEIKYDGYRIVCRIDREADSIRFFTRKGYDFTDRLPGLKNVMATLPVKQAWLDGEIVILTPDGKSDFNALQNAFSQGNDHGIVYLVFDIMNYEGYDLRGAPLCLRKGLLEDLIPQIDRLRYVDHMMGHGEEFYREACARRLEGIVSKQADAEYVSNRTRSWLKIKCIQRQEFIVGGYTESGAGRPFGSLLAGYFDSNGSLVFAGKIKTGYGQSTSNELIGTMRQYEQPEPPFVTPPAGPEYRNPHWLKPELIAEVEFAEISGTGLLRHASFKGLREDKKPEEVLLERPQPLLEAPAAKKPPVFPAEKITREGIRSYYELVADKMLPYLTDRPLTLIVCPTNIYACKFTKHATNLQPPVKGIDAGHAEKYIAIDSKDGLLALVDAGMVEIHGWQCRYTRLEIPDRLVFDLDPPEQGSLPWERLAEAALLLRLHLQKAGLESFLQTTGGKGYYVVGPLNPVKPWGKMTPFAKRVSEEMEQLYPDRFTAKLAKNERGNRIYLDWMRNGRGANAAEPYSIRARPGAPIAVPVTWEELVLGIKPDSFNLGNIRKRLDSLAADPWEGYFRVEQELPQ